ncbi:MAG: SatD family protein [Bacteroidales bacterium]|nr:SatD family protein [Bacteroidales bacterium]
MKAVITADIIDYSKLSIEEENLVIDIIYDTFEDDEYVRTNVDSSFMITRGDSVQIELDKKEEALNVALLLKSAINKIALSESNKTKPTIDVRIAIGVGEILGKRENVNESTGDAYTFSGRTLDMMKKNKRTLAIATNNKELNAELETEFRLLEVVLSGWTVNSAEVIYWTILGLNEREISEKLKKSQSAINQRKKTAGWNGIEPLIKRYKELMKREAIKLIY